MGFLKNPYKKFLNGKANRNHCLTLSDQANEYSKQTLALAMTEESGKNEWPADTIEVSRDIPVFALHRIKDSMIRTSFPYTRDHITKDGWIKTDLISYAPLLSFFQIRGVSSQDHVNQLYFGRNPSGLPEYPAEFLLDDKIWRGIKLLCEQDCYTSAVKIHLKAVSALGVENYIAPISLSDQLAGLYRSDVFDAALWTLSYLPCSLTVQQRASAAWSIAHFVKAIKTSDLDKHQKIVQAAFLANSFWWQGASSDVAVCSYDPLVVLANAFRENKISFDNKTLYVDCDCPIVYYMRDNSIPLKRKRIINRFLKQILLYTNPTVLASYSNAGSAVLKGVPSEWQQSLMDSDPYCETDAITVVYCPTLPQTITGPVEYEAQTAVAVDKGVKKDDDSTGLRPQPDIKPEIPTPPVPPTPSVPSTTITLRHIKPLEYPESAGIVDPEGFLVMAGRMTKKGRHPADPGNADFDEASVTIEGEERTFPAYSQDDCTRATMSQNWVASDIPADNVLHTAKGSYIQYTSAVDYAYEGDVSSDWRSDLLGGEYWVGYAPSHDTFAVQTSETEGTYKIVKADDNTISCCGSASVDDYAYEDLYEWFWRQHSLAYKRWEDAHMASIARRVDVPRSYVRLLITLLLLLAVLFLLTRRSQTPLTRLAKLMHEIQRLACERALLDLDATVSYESGVPTVTRLDESIKIADAQLVPGIADASSQLHRQIYIQASFVSTTTNDEKVRTDADVTATLEAAGELIAADVSTLNDVLSQVERLQSADTQTKPQAQTDADQVGDAAPSSINTDSDPRVGVTPRYEEID